MTADPLEALVLAVDPGRDKCGLAVVGRSGSIHSRQVVDRNDLRARAQVCLQDCRVQAIVLGKGTGYREAASELGDLGPPVVAIDEQGTTLEARRRYFQVNPPRGWRRWIPTGMRIPPEPFDDWAAVLLAERYWSLSEGA